MKHDTQPAPAVSPEVHCLVDSTRRLERTLARLLATVRRAKGREQQSSSKRQNAKR